MNIKYCINLDGYYKLANEKSLWREIGFFEPEPILPLLDKELSYLNCPAFIDYYKNTFLIRCPFDITIETRRRPDNKIEVRYTGKFDEEFYSDNILVREDGSITVNVGYYFMTDENSLLIEQLQPIILENQFYNDKRMIQGTFDIGKWVRPLDWAFHPNKGVTKIELKRGDPLYCVRFMSTNKVNLERVDFNKDISNVGKATTLVKHTLGRFTLKENYEMAKYYVSSFKKKLFKSKLKCPFKHK